MDTHDDEQMTLCVKVELVKPVDVEWEDAGKTLRGLQERCHRVLNDAERNLLLTAHLGQPYRHPMTGKPFVTAIKTAKGPAGQPKENLQSVTYDLVKDHPDTPQGDMVLELAGAVWVAFTRYNKEVNAGMSRNAPSFKLRHPIPIKATSFSLRKDDDSYVATLRLFPGTELSFYLGISGGSAHAIMKRILDGEYTYGAAKVMWKDDKKKWMLLISYKRPKPEQVQGQIAAIHRGVYAMLYGAAADGSRGTIINGDDLIHEKKKISSRKRQLQSQASSAGQGAHGHGRKRRMQALDKLRNYEESWSRTKCQQAASALVRWCGANGVNEVVLENWSTIEDTKTTDWLIQRWPWALLRDCCMVALDKAGVRYSLSTHKLHCPSCGSNKVYTVNGHTHCMKCPLHERSDSFQCLSMLHERGVDIAKAVARMSAAAKKELKHAKEEAFAKQVQVLLDASDASDNAGSCVEDGACAP